MDIPGPGGCAQRLTRPARLPAAWPSAGLALGFLAAAQGLGPRVGGDPGHLLGHRATAAPPRDGGGGELGLLSAP